MALRFRYLLAIAFTMVAIVPVLFLGVWLQRTSLEAELAAVHEKHLLLASNMTAALERYARDAEAAFDLFAETAGSDLPLTAMKGLAVQLGFRHFCIIEDSGEIRWQIALENARDRIPPGILEQILEFAESDRLFSPVIADRAGRPTIHLVRRLGDNRIAVGAIATDYIVQLQKAITFGRKGHAAIVDQEGNLLAHPNPDWQQQMKNIAKVEPVRRMMAGETGVATFFSPAMRRDMISGFNTVKTSGWGVMVPQPIEELEEKAFEVQLAALAMAMAGLVAAAVISWLIAGFLMRPIDSVVTAARRIAGGDLAARVPGSPPLTPLELRELSGGFNSMAERIEDHQKAMQAALEEARLANRTKSEFLANMSHEFRTPLNAVIGFSDTMRQQILGPLGSARYREYVENIYSSGKHLLAIISDILDLSKIEAGRMDIEDDVFDAAEMIEESLVLIRPRAAEAELTIEVETETGLPPLRASKVKMKQVLVNLLANAVRFTPTGGTVRCSTARGRDGDLHIRVSDTGIGMTAAEIELALEPFAQVDSKLSRKYEGTGLGLPLARRLVELHGGYLEVESQPRNGTTAHIHLPASRFVLAEAAE